MADGKWYFRQTDISAQASGPNPVVHGPYADEPAAEQARRHLMREFSPKPGAWIFGPPFQQATVPVEEKR